MRVKQMIIGMVLICTNVFSGCSNAVYSSNNVSSITESKSEETKIPTNIAESTIAPIDYQHGYYDAFSPEVYNQSETGSVMNYDEAMDMISDINNGVIRSFYLVKTIKALTLEECEKLNGWNEWFKASYALDYNPDLKSEHEYFGDKTIYEVEIVSDLLKNTEGTGNMYVAISMGNPLEQQESDPTYCPGEMFTVAVYEPDDNSEIMRSCGVFMLRYDIEVYDGDYHVLSRNNYEIDKLKIDGSNNINEIAVTSTTANPVRYSQELTLNKLTEFIKSDWAERGII